MAGCGGTLQSWIDSSVFSGGLKVIRFLTFYTNQR